MKQFLRLFIPLGVLGFTAAALSAYTVTKAHAAITPSTTTGCTSSSPCFSAINSGSGDAINGYAHNNVGVRGSTIAKLAGIKMVNGQQVLVNGGTVGDDLSTDPSTDANSGVVGYSNVGAGVSGYTANTVVCGCGTDVFSAAVLPAVFGYDAGPMNGFAGGVTNVAVVGQSLTRAGVMGLARTGYGAVGRTFTGTGLLGVSRGAGGVALAAKSLQGGPVFIGSNANKDVASLDSNGNLIIAGTLHTQGTPLLATRSSNGALIATYGARESSPTVEDFGQAQMRYGFAQVRIDPGFAQLINRAAPYMVFLTPEGDNRGLYVTNKTLGGFTVRESQGGRSTLTFSYRIVAGAYGEQGRRFALERALPSVQQVTAHQASRLPHRVSE